jgi:hypothetical protein
MLAPEYAADAVRDLRPCMLRNRGYEPFLNPQSFFHLEPPLGYIL